MLAAGADGCRAGWICVTRHLGTPRLASACYPDAKALFEQRPRPGALGLDIPIGLPARGPRDCDVEARLRLGPRRSSVFPAPLRPLLAAHGWEEACEVRWRVEGKRISRQLWNILARIREVDDALRRDLAGARGFVREVHPELCFLFWSGAPMQHPKKRPAGRAEREALVARHFGADAFARVRASHPRAKVGSDDILDAFAALWTAERMLDGRARSLPAVPPRDGAGLPMEIVA